MNYLKSFLASIIILTIISCSSGDNADQSGPTYEEPGVNIQQASSEDTTETGEIRTRPSNVILTGNKTHRLVTIYKINKNKKTGKDYIGSNNFYGNYFYNANDEYTYLNFMPSIKALYGYNMLNVSHYNLDSNISRNLFETPVLINTLYYPSDIPDSLNKKPIVRNYYMVSVYNEDTNNDSLINKSDLRRFYRFDINGLERTTLIPPNYSVMNSQYDSDNDIMYVFARLNENENGSREMNEPIHVFWIDLKNPEIGSRVY